MACMRLAIQDFTITKTLNASKNKHGGETRSLGKRDGEIKGNIIISNIAAP